VDTLVGQRSDATPPLILVDAMLVNVARDLRLLGYDAAYAGRASDAEVLRKCQREGRLLVTRDRELARRAGAIPHVLVRQAGRTGQILEVLRALGAGPPPNPMSRCLRCNEVLEDVSPAEAWERVPDHIALDRAHFSACPRCQRMYWEGSHLGRLRARIRRLSDALQGQSPPV